MSEAGPPETDDERPPPPSVPSRPVAVERPSAALRPTRPDDDPQPTLFPLPEAARQASARDAAADDWSAPERRAGEEPEEAVLVVDVGGFEGPLDLLLALARSQKVDLARISILALADQYLAYIEAVRRTRLELAADYLVMAAWLAYLKSRLLLPSPPADDQPSGEQLAAELAFRLRRLEAMRAAAGRLVNRNRLGREVFPRGAPEPILIARRDTWADSMFDLLSAYAGLRQRRMVTTVRVARRSVWSLPEAREILERLIGRLADWTPIQTFLAAFMTPEMRATVLASSFSASLELAREGKIELAQSSAFAPLFVRRRTEATEEVAIPVEPAEAGHDPDG